jgi:hypothetical protein
VAAPLLQERSADRGMASVENERLARQAGVQRIALPCVGRASPARRQREEARWFRRGYRFRAESEGRLHLLCRDYGLKRRRYHGERGMGRLGDRSAQSVEDRGSGGE